MQRKLLITLLAVVVLAVISIAIYHSGSMLTHSTVSTFVANLDEMSKWQDNVSFHDVNTSARQAVWCQMFGEKEWFNRVYNSEIVTFNPPGSIEYNYGYLQGGRQLFDRQRKEILSKFRGEFSRSDLLWNAYCALKPDFIKEVKKHPELLQRLELSAHYAELILDQKKFSAYVVDTSGFNDLAEKVRENYTATSPDWDKVEQFRQELAAQHPEMTSEFWSIYMWACRRYAEGGWPAVQVWARIATDMNHEINHALFPG
jgi:hypothetical protein